MSVRTKRIRSQTNDSKSNGDSKRKKKNSSSGKSNWKKLLKSSSQLKSSVVYKNKKTHLLSIDPSSSSKDNDHQQHSSEINTNPDQTISFSTASSGSDSSTRSPITRNNKKPTITKYLSMDCEMVGVGSDSKRSMLARVCIVNTFGDVVYDKYALPTEKVTDYRTWVSGIEPKHILPHLSTNAIPFADVQADVTKLLKGRILVGHGLVNDLKCLLISHPFRMIRDTARYRKLQWARGKPRSLKNLVKYHLGLEIQNDEHDPAIDAWCAYLLYRNFKPEWEKHLTSKGHPPPKSKKSKKANLENITSLD